MAPKRPFLSDEDEWAELHHPILQRERGEEASFHETGHYGYVALAIARWVGRADFPNGRPEWAVQVCLKLQEDVSISSSPVLGKKRGPKRHAQVDQHLEQIADIMLDAGLRKKFGIRSSVRAAARHVLGLQHDQEDNADYRLLRRIWKQEGHHRLARAVIRYHRKLKAAGLLPSRETMNKWPRDLS